jgi:predicted nucleotidyltransferase
MIRGLSHDPMPVTRGGTARMDMIEVAKAYRRRAEAREAERVTRHEALREQARAIAARLHEVFGPRVRIYLLGSLLDIERFRSDSDIDIAVEGLNPAEYWEASRMVELLAGRSGVDLIRLETAADSLRESVQTEAEELR